MHVHMCVGAHTWGGGSKLMSGAFFNQSASDTLRPSLLLNLEFILSAGGLGSSAGLWGSGWGGFPISTSYILELQVGC